MKRILLTLASVLLCAITFAQSVPQGINYQAVARDANGDELTNQSLTVKLSVISASVTGTVSWQETHAVTTNDFGLFTAVIGGGTSTGSGSSATFDAIAWGSSNHYLKVEINTGSGYVDMGTTQLMSVPYALQSETSGDTPMLQGQIISNQGQIMTNFSSFQNFLNQSCPSGTFVTGFSGMPGQVNCSPGQVGPAGADGAQGPVGPAGADGVDGAQGPVGPAGADGSVGAIGPQGPVGNDGAVGATGAIGAQGPAGNDGMDISGTIDQTLRHDGTDWVATSNIKNDGTNVGIGTSSFSNRLTIRGTGSTSATNSLLVENSVGTDIFKIRDDGRVAIGTSPNTNYQLYNYVPSTSSADYAQRNYFYRTSSAAGSMYGLYSSVNRGSSAVSGLVYGVFGYANNSVGTSSTYGIRGYAAGSSTGSKYAIYGSTGGSGNRYAGYFSGDVYCSGTYTPSDESLKKNISDYDNALDQLSSIQVKEYEYIQEGDMSKMDLPKGRQVGIMAQNIENVFPQLTKDTEFDLNDDPENEDEDREENIFKFKAVNYTGMIPVTIKAIQEQQEMIKEQQEMIKQLQEDNQDFKNRITLLENK